MDSISARKSTFLHTILPDDEIVKRSEKLSYYIAKKSRLDSITSSALLAPKKGERTSHQSCPLIRGADANGSFLIGWKSSLSPAFKMM